MVWLWLMGCGGPGFADGVLQVEDPSGEVVELSFDAGALAWTLEGTKGVALSTVKTGFTCDYVRTGIESLAGKDVDRRRDHQDLVWRQSDPGTAVVWWNEEHALGGGGSLGATELEAEMVFDPGELSGELVTEAGTVVFEAEDCGAL